MYVVFLLAEVGGRERGGMNGERRGGRKEGGEGRLRGQPRLCRRIQDAESHNGGCGIRPLQAMEERSAFSGTLLPIANIANYRSKKKPR